MSLAYRTGLAVGFGAEPGRTSAEDLGFSIELDMNLQADHRFVFHVFLIFYLLFFVTVVV
jgi:hypothetical protein